MTLTVDGLRKAYGEQTAIDGISFSVEPGEIVGLLGQNGAGKTTTVDIICGLLETDEGSFEIRRGTELVAPNDHAGLLGYVSQKMSLFPPLTIRQNLQFALGVRGVRRAEADDRIEQLIDELELGELADRRTAKLSGGELRRVHIAMRIAHRPPLLILDEPTSGVDIQSRLLIQRWLRTARTNGATILYTTHYLEEAQTLCDNVVILHRGEVIASDAVSTMVERFGSGAIHCELTTEPSDAAVADIGGRVPGVTCRRVEGCPQELIISGPEVSDRVSELIASLADLGLAVGRLRVVPATLESAFLNLTNENFDEVGAE